MPRQANGNYLPPANTAAVTGTTISSTAYNTLETDIGTEITNSVDRGGRSAMTANLPMGANKITGMADPSVATDAVTKNYADTLVASFFSTGDVKWTIKTAPDTGWVMMDDRTIGSASSGATNRANSDTQALFTLLFNNIADGFAPLQTAGGAATTRAAQVSASAAWVANCRIAVLIVASRALGIAGSGASLTPRSLGGVYGEENHTLTASEIPLITSSVTATNVTVFARANTGGFNANTAPNTTYLDNIQGTGGGGTSSFTYPVSPPGATSSNTGGAGHNNMQPTTFINAMMKL